MENYVKLTDVETLEKTLADNQDHLLLLFKHSTRCPISAKAFREFESFLQTEEGKKVPAAVVLVVEDRPVSNAIAERFGIRHASPQVILLKNGEVCWHTSHYNIRSEALLDAVKTNR
ncbi:bacillithiol system redox-active protein YtxJ [Thermoactinomyces mirandus]|uniref:Bacillithiol system redox-active protein YtxJ n=1 Tax=Thermoactinomyces mirandus TaxID=2756294 RepID=A0A7W2ARE0_9BACL|nr:bacillithiol system redox-active protein YtxJ [Thermoactinomyces mirandus]MBA4601475.1 bacillithiol system redox-active protein YtxJ [Thermoactinomyces mirandus]